MKFWLMFAAKVHITFEIYNKTVHRLPIPVIILKNRCDGVLPSHLFLEAMTIGKTTRRPLSTVC